MKKKLKINQKLQQYTVVRPVFCTATHQDLLSSLCSLLATHPSDKSLLQIPFKSKHTTFVAQLRHCSHSRHHTSGPSTVETPSWGYLNQTVRQTGIASGTQKSEHQSGAGEIISADDSIAIWIFVSSGLVSGWLAKCTSSRQN